MISSEVQRTLVKSPPELWAELSDPDALARQLGELGEIRITRAEPEKRVEWEAEGTSGSVLIKPSGWGTKVTLSVTREIEASAPEVEQDTNVAEAEPALVSEAAEMPEKDAEIEAQAAPATEIVEPDCAVLESEPETPAFEPEATDAPEEAEAPRRGFFARLFGRRRPKVPDPAETPLGDPIAPPPADSASIPWPESKTSAARTIERARSSSAIESLQARFQAVPARETVVKPGPEAEAAPEPEADQAPEPIETAAEAVEASTEAQDSSPEPARDLAAELKAVEETAAEEVTAVLTAVLDRLGAAHHRPFSRS